MCVYIYIYIVAPRTPAWIPPVPSRVPRLGVIFAVSLFESCLLASLLLFMLLTLFACLEVILLAHFSAAHSVGLRRAACWGHQKGGFCKPMVYHFPQFPSYKSMPSCLGQWCFSLNDLFMTIEEQIREHINRRFTNPFFGSTECGSSRARHVGRSPASYYQ